MFEIKKTESKEDRKVTMDFINSNRNWQVEKQEDKISEKEISKINLKDCDIYWRGDYLIVSHNNIIFYWENNGGHLKKAVELLNLESEKKWKTLDKLISFRCAIRETEVNCLGLVENIFEDENMTLIRFNSFMTLAKAHDILHHGTRTF